MQWTNNNQILDKSGLGGVFLYWDNVSSPDDGRYFAGCCVGKLTTSGLHAGLNGSWTQVAGPTTLWTQQVSWVRIDLYDTRVEYRWSLTGASDSWYLFSTQTRPSNISAEPTHLIFGRGYASTTTLDTYMRNCTP